MPRKTEDDSRKIKLANDLVDGDTWIGEDGNVLEIEKVGRGPVQNFLPWSQGPMNIPVPMIPVMLFGTLRMVDGDDFTGQWILQPDQPVEVV